MTDQSKNLENEQELAQTQAETELEQPATSEQTTSEQADPLAQAIERVQELESQLEDFAKKEQDILLRTRAEIDNIRRRSEQDVEKAHKFALEKFAKEIINTVDNLERAIATQTNNTELEEGVKALFDGVELTLKDLLSTLSRFGVEPIGEMGENFNPDFHQAISMQPTEGFNANQITAVLQKGYLLNGRIIRPAMVMVAA